MESKTSRSSFVAAWVLLFFFAAAAEAAAAAGGEAAAAWSTGSTMTEAWKTLEVAVEPEPLPAELDGVWSRFVLSGSITPKALVPNQPGCIGPCPAPGGPYTGRGCNPVYHNPECGTPP
ncbi:unnamed protein product [Urochloa humidicola]